MRLRTSIVGRLVLAAVMPTLAVAAGLPLGCATTQAMRTGVRVPASEATVKATEGDNGNTRLTIRVKHLAQPSKVAADATVYVVWIQPSNAKPQNVGALSLNDNLEGHLDTMTPHRRFLMIVTPEPSALVGHPTHEPVFTSKVERAK